ncbi:IclR family transcriptional regulator [Nocardioides sp. cx-169]|uniref:IclR family transcriptional regulator n=1 Tax=Nocardioides sp. cx-169 TaxID=2899080 RepID=UPI001E30407A|nr:IclR family transcriptional regulator [Nocardioides sp. cx-169]MCD4534281.1 IclR family transcriptional regulator [Nocardioides sp. cx-169]
MSVLAKATQTLDCLGAADGPLRLRDVAAAVGMPKSSTHRMLSELTALGIVRREGDRYAIGPRLLYWGAIASEGYDLRAYAEAPMRRLRDRLGESVHLYVDEDGHKVCIASVESHYSLRPFVALGRPGQLGAGSSGKLLLAFAGDARRRAVLAELARQGDRHAPTVAELDLMREDQWAVSFGELEDGVVAAATSVCHPDGRLAAVITVSGPAHRLVPERLGEFREPMRECSADIAALLKADVHLAAAANR